MFQSFLGKRQPAESNFKKLKDIYTHSDTVDFKLMNDILYFALNQRRYLNLENQNEFDKTFALFLDLPRWVISFLGMVDYLSNDLDDVYSDKSLLWNSDVAATLNQIITINESLIKQGKSIRRLDKIYEVAKARLKTVLLKTNESLLSFTPSKDPHLVDLENSYRKYFMKDTSSEIHELILANDKIKFDVERFPLSGQNSFPDKEGIEQLANDLDYWKFTEGLHDCFDQILRDLMRFPKIKDEFKSHYESMFHIELSESALQFLSYIVLPVAIQSSDSPLMYGMQYFMRYSDRSAFPPEMWFNLQLLIVSVIRALVIIKKNVAVCPNRVLFRYPKRSEIFCDPCVFRSIAIPKTDIEVERLSYQKGFSSWGRCLDSAMFVFSGVYGDRYKERTKETPRLLLYIAHLDDIQDQLYSTESLSASTPEMEMELVCLPMSRYIMTKIYDTVEMTEELSKLNLKGIDISHDFVTNLNLEPEDDVKFCFVKAIQENPTWKGELGRLSFHGQHH